VFAVEITFQAVAHGFMQQYARPAAAQHHRHRTGRGGAGFQIGERLLHGGIHIFACNSFSSK
jgi:hypothetical protein